MEMDTKGPIPKDKPKSTVQRVAKELNVPEGTLKKQLGRRNLSDEERFRLIGQMQENRKKAVGEHKGNQYSKKMELCQNEPIPKSTAAQIAEEVGVSESTVKRAEKFSKGIDAIQDVSPEAAQKILKGGSGITKEFVASIPAMPDERKIEAIEAVKSGPEAVAKFRKKVEGS